MAEASENKQHLQKQAVTLARKALYHYFQKQAYLHPPANISPFFHKQSGVFVTLTKNGHPRACMGTIYPQEENIAREIIANTVKAAFFDFIYPPLEAGELKSVKFSISIIGPLRPVSSTGQLEPKKFGLFVKSGKKSAILLPGEAKTAVWQIERCRQKAGLKKGEPFEMFIFETLVFKEG